MGIFDFSHREIIDEHIDKVAVSVMAAQEIPKIE